MKARARASSSFLKGDARSNSQNRAAPQDDTAWFACHPARHHRLRPPIGAEATLCAPPPRVGCFHGWTAVFAIRRTTSGEIIRLPVPWPPRTPLLGEQRARAVFAWSAGIVRAVG